METAEHTTTSASCGDEPVVLDRYRLQRRLGGGGFGVVWLAHDLKLDRAVAVKRIPCGDADTARRADRESVAAARLQHPAIVALYEAVADEDAVFLVSELVHGSTYAALLAEGALSDRDVVAIGLAMCDALTHAHRRGVVHRDVKPPNILVPGDGDGAGPAAKLTDFGVARIAGDDALTQTGDVVGTLAYMAPEQAEGAEAGPEADLYALGLCLYEGLAGVNPVRARGAGATARRVGQRLPPLGRLRRDLPLELCDAIDAAVWPDPAQRGSIADLRRALAGARRDVDDEPGTIAGGPLEPIAGVTPAVRTPVPGRLVAAALAAGLAAAGPLLLGDAAGISVLPAALGTAAAVALLPRLGWLMAAIVLPAALAGAQPGTALLAAAGLAPVPLLLRFAPAWTWSAAALAPAAALVSAGGAFPALAGRAPRWSHRAALGALGAWWLAIAGVLADRTLLLAVPGSGSDGWRAPALRRTSGDALDALGALLTTTTGAAIAAFAVAAILLPWLVRGRLLTVDIVAATAWSAGLAAALQAGAGVDGRTLVVGAVAAWALALALRPRPGESPPGLDAR